jgi:predicted nucleic acid-binding Zn finger protein
MAAEVLNFKKEPIDINNLPKRQKPQKTQEQKDEEAKAYELWCKLSLEAETLLRADQAEKEVKKQEEAKRKQEEDAKKKEEDAKKKKEEDEIWQHKYNHMSLKEKFFQENLLKRNSNYKLYDELLQKMEEQKQYVNEVTNQAKLDFSVYLKYLVLEKKYILNIDFSSKSIFIIYYVLYLADKQKLEERHAIKIELNRVLAEAEKK